jgi:hypothetical protein
MATDRITLPIGNLGPYWTRRVGHMVEMKRCIWRCSHEGSGVYESMYGNTHLILQMQSAKDSARRPDVS